MKIDNDANVVEFSEKPKGEALQARARVGAR